MPIELDNQLDEETSEWESQQKIRRDVPPPLKGGRAGILECTEKTWSVLFVP